MKKKLKAVLTGAINIAKAVKNEVQVLSKVSFKMTKFMAKEIGGGIVSAPKAVYNNTVFSNDKFWDWKGSYLSDNPPSMGPIFIDKGYDAEKDPNYNHSEYVASSKEKYLKIHDPNIKMF